MAPTLTHKAPSSLMHPRPWDTNYAYAAGVVSVRHCRCGRGESTEPRATVCGPRGPRTRSFPGTWKLEPQFEPPAGNVFFAQLLENVREGYFADPLYGGNRGMAAWKWIGFPGARADFTDWIDQAGQDIPLWTRCHQRREG